MPVAMDFLPQPPPLATNSISAAAAPVATNDGAGLILKAASDANTPSLNMFTLRHLAMVAKRRNAYGLMTRVVRACKEFAVRLDDVMSEPEASEPGASLHPFEILRVVSDAECYCQARTIGPDGSNSFFQNAAFEHDIMSLEACTRAYERNEREVLSYFVHPDDLFACQSCITGAWILAARHSGRLMQQESPDRIRVYHRRLQTYISCKMRSWMFIICDTGIVSLAFVLTPHGDGGCSSSLTLQGSNDDGGDGMAATPGAGEQPALQLVSVSSSLLQAPFDTNSSLQELLDGNELDELLARDMV